MVWRMALRLRSGAVTATRFAITPAPIFRHDRVFRLCDNVRSARFWSFI